MLCISENTIWFANANNNNNMIYIEVHWKIWEETVNKIGCVDWYKMVYKWLTEFAVSLWTV